MQYKVIFGNCTSCDLLKLHQHVNFMYVFISTSINDSPSELMGGLVINERNEEEKNTQRSSKACEPGVRGTTAFPNWRQNMVIVFLSV